MDVVLPSTAEKTEGSLRRLRVRFAVFVALESLLRCVLYYNATLMFCVVVGRSRRGYQGPYRFYLSPKASRTDECASCDSKSTCASAAFGALAPASAQNESKNSQLKR